MMKKIYFSLITTIFLFCNTAFAQVNHDVNSIAAVVNDTVITQTDLDKQVNLIEARLKNSHVALPSEKIIREQVLEQLITRELQLQQAKQLGLKVTPKQIDEAVERLAAENKTSVKNIYLSSEKSGYSREGFRKEVGKEILMQMAQAREIGPRISISQQAVSDYLETLKNSHETMAEYHLGDILIALPDSPSPEQIESAKNKADNIVAKLRKGADFEKLAVADSANGSGLRGGDMGWRKLAELPTPFVDAVKTMAVGSVANPIRTPNGYHILKLFGKHNQGGLSGTPEQQRKTVEQMLFERQFNQALVNWVSQLRGQAYIKIYPDD